MTRNKFVKIISLFLLCITLGGTALSVQAAPGAQDDGPVVISSEVEEFTSYFSVENLVFSDGASLQRGIINGPSEPSAEYAEEIAASFEPLPTEGVIADVPSYSWVFGSSAVSGAMIAGYFDSHGYPNMYTGATNGGVMPLSDTFWPTWSDGVETHPNNPLVASHKGVDGRSNKGSIDDYWVQYGSYTIDPYITGSWAEHTWDTAIGDYMKTSQSVFDNTDGATSFYNYIKDTASAAEKLTCEAMEIYGIQSQDGTYGRKLFYEAQGYTVTECYSQRTDNDVSGGFSLGDFQAQIDAGNPVLLNLEGHSMVGYGYSGSTIYIRNTWDNDPSQTYSMPWGGPYMGLELYAVSIVNLLPPPTVPTPVAPSYSTSTHTPQYIWTKVYGATMYEYEVYAGVYKMFNSIQGTGNCGANYCFHTPLRILPDRGYTFRVRAKVGGVWQNWSSYKWYMVSTNFTSNFTSSTKGWQVVYGPWSLFNANFYRTTGWLDSANSVVHDGLYPTLTYSVRMMRIGNKNGANRVMVRAAPYPLRPKKGWDDGYHFQYANAGQFSVFKMVNGVSTTLIGWTATDAINSYGWNVLKVVANGSNFKFYINNQLVWSGSDSSLSNGRVGLGMYKPEVASPLWQPLLVDTVMLSTSASSSSSEVDVWAEMCETNTTWDNMDVAPPLP